MAYLSSKGFVHRDLAARNILVSQDDTCKVTGRRYCIQYIIVCSYIEPSCGIHVFENTYTCEVYKSKNSSLFMCRYVILACQETF